MHDARWRSAVTFWFDLVRFGWIAVVCVFSCFFVFVFEISLENPVVEEAAKGPKGRKGPKRVITRVGEYFVFSRVQLCSILRL
jgi:hypothetical protein